MTPRNQYRSQQSLQILFDLSELYGKLSLSLSINLNGKKSQIKSVESCEDNSSNSNVSSLDELLCNRINTLDLNLNININQITEPISCEEATSDYIKKYITIFGQSVSILCLTLLLIMYSSHKLLRNLPGKILICLSFSLLLSQVSFITSIYITKPYVYYRDLESNSSNQTKCNENQIETENSFENIIIIIVFSKSFDCYIMSMLSHYFHLAFFSWSNIMAYDLFKTFTTLSSSKNSNRFISYDQNDNKIKFIKYSLYAWLLPFAIVSMLFLFQFVFNEIAYGFTTCFISSQIYKLVFFVAPVCVLLFFNQYFLISSIKSIRSIDKLSKKYLKKDEDPSSSLMSNQTTKKTSSYDNLSKLAKKKTNAESSNSQNEKKRLILFGKLFVLTGMTWIFGLFSSFDKYSFIWYIYIVLNSLQGMFIFVAYAFTPQTKNNVTRSRVYKSLSTLLRKKSSSYEHQGSLEVKNI
jgi:hypothetical protein